MRILLPLLVSFLTILCFGQKGNVGVKPGENNFSQLNDSLPQVIYKNIAGTHRNPAWFVDGKEVGESAMKTLDSEQIALIDVRKKEVIIENISYDGKVSITLKEGYHPRFISLNELKSKYTKIKDSPVLFMLENDIIRGDYDKNLVDECFLLQIIVEKVEVKSGNMDFYLVRLITRSPENIKKSKEIRIR